MKAEDFIKNQVTRLCAEGGVSEYKASVAAQDAVSEYRKSGDIKGGVPKMIERHAKAAIKASKAENAKA